MDKQSNLNHLLLSLAATMAVFIFTAAYAPSIHAEVTQAYKTNTATPVVLAWYRNNWYGHRYGYR